MKLLESMVESANSDKKTAECQLAETQELYKAAEIEVTRLKTALDSAKEKVSFRSLKNNEKVNNK